MPKKKTAALVVEEFFECKASARVWAEVDEAGGRVFIHAGFYVRDPAGRPIEAPGGHLAETPPHVEGFDFSLPLTLLDSQEKITAFVRGVRDRFAAFGPLLLAEQGAVFLYAARDLQTGDLDPSYREEVTDEKMLLAEHLERTENILRLIYGIKPPTKKNGRSKWTKDELSRELKEVARQFGRGERPTFQDAAALLNARNPGRRLKSGEVLRKLCDRLGVPAKKFRNRGGNRNGKSVPVGGSKRNEN